MSSFFQLFAERLGARDNKSISKQYDILLNIPCRISYILSFSESIIF
ncbi:hypothetical protein HMPREF1249_0224 [Jonquetella sp. BV3C21]|nr:hypothetical protein HMPREF1249_0224 [Jonquetella sp. BV3C21]